jgi:hypothetical protein
MNRGFLLIDASGTCFAVDLLTVSLYTTLHSLLSACLTADSLRQGAVHEKIYGATR